MRRQRPRKRFEHIEFARLEGVGWDSDRCLLEPLGHVRPAEFTYYDRQAARGCEVVLTERARTGGAVRDRLRYSTSDPVLRT